MLEIVSPSWLLTTSKVTSPAVCLKVTFNVVELTTSTLSANVAKVSLVNATLQLSATAAAVVLLKVSTVKESSLPEEPTEGLKSKAIFVVEPACGVPVNTILIDLAAIVDKPTLAKSVAISALVANADIPSDNSVLSAEVRPDVLVSATYTFSLQTKSTPYRELLLPSKIRTG